jgi:hypothetical protein
MLNRRETITRALTFRRARGVCRSYQQQRSAREPYLDKGGPREPGAAQGGCEAVGHAEGPPRRALLREEAVDRAVGLGRRGGERARPRSGREEAPRPRRRREEEEAVVVRGETGGGARLEASDAEERMRREAQVVQRHRGGVGVVQWDGLDEFG